MKRMKQTVWPVWSSWVVILVLLTALTAGTLQTAYATEFRGGDTVVINANEVIDDDLFVSGQIVEVNGTIKGNLFASGTTVTVNGKVEGSLFIAGQTLVTNSTVDGSIYVGGYAFTLGPEAKVGRNLYFGGFSLTTAKGSQIDRSINAGGYQILLNGAVANDVNVGAGALELSGIVGGNVRGEVASAQEGTPPFIFPFAGAVTPVTPGLRVTESAQIGGEMAVTVQQAPPAPDAWTVFWTAALNRMRWVAGEFIALLIVGALFLWVWATPILQTSAEVRARWLPDLGVGLLIMIVVAIAVPLVIGLVIGLAILAGFLTFGQLLGDVLGLGLSMIGLVLTTFLFVLAMLTKILVAHAGGRMLMARLSPSMEGNTLDYAALVLGVLIYMLMRAIPFGIGWLFGALVTLVGLGALWMVIWGLRQPTLILQKTPVPTAVEAPV